MNKQKVIKEINKVKLNDKVLMNMEVFYCIINKEDLYSFEMKDCNCLWGTMGVDIEELKHYTIIDYYEGVLNSFKIINTTSKLNKLLELGYRVLNKAESLEELFINTNNIIDNEKYKLNDIEEMLSCFEVVEYDKEYYRLG